MMTIRFKVIALVALLFAVLAVAEVVIQERVLMPNFADLERASARTSMTRVDNALDRTLERLGLNAEEWSNWGELYQFMQDFNPAFIATYTTPAALTPLKINLLLLADGGGQVVFSAARTLESGEPLSLDLAARQSLPEDFPWRRNLAEGKPARGLLRTGSGVMMLAAAPIFNGSGGGKPLGMTVMGRLLTPAQLHELGTQAQAELKLLTPSAAPARELVETADRTQVYRSYADIYGKPLMTLEVDVPRSITAQGRTAVAYSALYLFGAAVACLALLLAVLNRVVLRRVARMTQHAVAVGDGGDLTARLNFAGNDEIGQLASAFDRMVERVAESRRQLMEQSFQAGAGELAREVMHNLGNAMTPLAVRLAMLARRLQSAPVSDVTAAAAEMASERVPAPRRVDLAQFIMLGCGEIEATFAAAHGDLAVMGRQASIVSAALAEQRAVADRNYGDFTDGT